MNERQCSLSASRKLKPGLPVLMLVWMCCFSEPLFFVKNRDDATCFISASKMLITYGRAIRKGYFELADETLSHLPIFPYRTLMTAILAWTPLNS